MELSRRSLLAGGFALVGGTMVGCSSGMDTSAPAKTNVATTLVLWCWPGGLGKSVLDETITHFPDPTIKYSEIGGDFKQKLITTFNGGTGIPDITGIKGEDIASMLPQANRFVDLKTVGADAILGDYLEWKVKQATTLDGKVLGIPIDIGPTALYYREDVFTKGGLPGDPAKVAAELSTWDDFIAAGVELRKANPKAPIVSDATDFYDIIIGQNPTRYIDKDNKFIGDQDHIRKAWDICVKMMTSKVDGKTPGGSPDWNAGLDQGTVPALVGAAWVALDVKAACKTSVGKWRLAPTPSGPANFGGSFLTITKNAADPAKAFEVIKYMLNADNQAKAFADAQIFPATPAAYDKPQLKAADPFFGGQVPIEVFGPAAKNIPVAYEAPADSAVAQPFKDELKSVQSGAKASDAAWSSAVSKAKAIAKRQGVQ
ncbi:cellobiose transport system substrate-binding protein [Kribbella sp. VKM Ac-2527]|uniref:Cellobiose transport system substrate-binding protein n=1 Tax=Kribbella caucasensis TaxID=2512215 RepID=A0A4R6KMX1_9ACTN|nr:extracellular solute-binding protein [Kribbella sp. VKM Ac-2527]TDO52793.1 cellobiose transport system substrate-binding protein [Kribbella sp. VKM Ac-2527]